MDGVGDGKAWDEEIPHDKTDNLEKVMSIAQKTLLTFDGQLFSHKLEQLSVANDRMQRVYELLDLKREDSESRDLIDRGLVTKHTSLMVHHHHEDKKEPSEAEAGDEKVQSSSAEFGRQGTARHVEVPKRQVSGHSMLRQAVNLCSCPRAVANQKK